MDNDSKMKAMKAIMQYADEEEKNLLKTKSGKSIDLPDNDDVEDSSESGFDLESLLSKLKGG